MAFWYQIVHVNIKNMLLKVSLVPANGYVNVKPRGSVYVHSLSNTLNGQELAKFIMLAREAD